MIKTMQVSLTEAAASLSELVRAAILRWRRYANDGEEVILLDGDRPAIKLTPIISVQPARKPGSAEGLVWMSDDFDAPLAEFKEYME
jgi:antitoxin (DNA-binding transcriptional repressor) of toxin-antitoxin stability system